MKKLYKLSRCAFFVEKCIPFTNSALWGPRAAHNNKLHEKFTWAPSPKVSKKVCHTHVGQKLREETDFPETGWFWHRAVPLMQADLTPLLQNHLYGVGMVLKISSRSFHSIKTF
jgi:hypothetical protein